MAINLKFSLSRISPAAEDVRHLADDPRHGINLGLIADEGLFCSGEISGRPSARRGSSEAGSRWARLCAVFAAALASALAP